MKVIIKTILLTSLSLFLNSCLLPNEKGSVSLNLSSSDEASREAAKNNDNNNSSDITVTQVQLNNDQIIVTGSELGSVTHVKLGDGLSDSVLSIVSQSANQLILSSSTQLSIALNTLLSLTLNSAQGAAVIQVTFNLPDSSVSTAKIGDGQVTGSKISAMGAGTGQVLRYNGSSWEPGDLNGLTFAGNWNANTNSPNLSAGGSLGQYYIVNTNGSTDLLGGPGTDSWLIGDWVVWNDVAGRWDKVDNGSNVTSFNGRNGPVSPQSGDYNWSMLANDTSIYIDYRPNNSACNDGEVLKYNSATPGWECASDDNTVGTGDISSVTAGIGLSGGATSGDATLDIDVGTSAGQIPQLDGSALLQTSIIPNLDTSKITSGTMATSRLPYASGSSDGILSSADYNTLAAKEGSISAGTTGQYFRGDKTWQTLDSSVVTENSNLYFTDARAKAAVVSTLITDGVTDMSPSEDAVYDALSTKQNTLTDTTNAIVGSVRIYDSVDQSHYIELLSPDISTNGNLTLPSTTGSSGDILSTNGAGILSWITPTNGTVTSVTASAPLSSSGGATPDISLSQASTSTNGYLSSADWNTFNNKEGALATGTTSQYYRGDKTWQTLDSSVVAENTNLYFTTARAQGAVVTQTITDGVTTNSPSEDAIHDALDLKEDSISTGTTSQYFRGDKSWQTLDTDNVVENSNLYFTDARAQNAVVTQTITDTVTDTSPSEDAVFDALATKQDTLTSTTTATVGAVRIYDSVDQSNYIDLLAPNLTSNTALTFPGGQGNPGDVLRTNGSGILSWTTPTVGTVTSVTASAPLSSSGGATPDISLSQASTSTNGYLSSTDWNTFNNKEGSLAAGTTSQYYRGDKTWQTLDSSVVAENTNLYFTNARAQAAAVTQNITNGVTLTAPSEDAVFDALALKEDSLAAGTTSQYYRGDKSWQTLDTSIVTENSNLYFTDARARAAVVTQNITNGTTATAPSEDAVFDALALKADLSAANSNYVNVTGDTMTGTLNLAANGLVAGTNQLVISGGNVGIGTASPSSKLEVQGDITLTHDTDLSGDIIGSGSDRRINIYSNTSALNSPSWLELWGETGTRDGETVLAGTYLDFRSGSTSSSSGTSAIRVDSTGNVGIGTTTPTRTLDVRSTLRVGTPTGTGAQSTAQANSTSSDGGYIETPWVYTSGLEAPSERASASTGIALGASALPDGTTTNSDSITSYTNGQARLKLENGNAIFQNNNGPVDITLKRDNNGSGVLNGEMIGSFRVETDLGDGTFDLSDFLNVEATEDHSPTGSGFKIGFRTIPNGSLASTDVMTISDTGQVGIGNNNPAADLDIGGNMFFNEGGGDVSIGPDIHLDANGLFGVDNNLYLNSASASGSFRFLFGGLTTAATESVRINSNGIEMSSGFIGSETENAGIDIFYFNNHESADFGCIDEGTNAGGLFYDRSDGLYLCRMGTKYRIADTGNGLSSDIRLKKEITDLKDVSKRLKSLRTVSFFWNDNYKKEYGSDNSKQIGILAQEMKEAFPELVIQKDESDYLQVKYRYLPILSIAALKEQQIEIEKNQKLFQAMQGEVQENTRNIASLQERNDQLEEKIDSLEKENQNLKDRLERIEKALGL